MTVFEFNCLPTMIGSLPHTDPARACALVAKYLKDIPAWPQLPRRSFRENMHAQYGEGFPGVVISPDKIYVNRARDLTQTLAEFYSAYLGNNAGGFPISRDAAAGLYAFLAMPGLTPRAVKGQVIGPVTWGLTVTDETGKGIIYDDTFGDAVPRLLRLKAAWQERQLKEVGKKTIIFVDEPYLSSFGSISMSLSRAQVIGLLEEVFAGIGGVKGVHCCGNTDWSILLATSADIISFDTYNYAVSLSLYPKEVKRFLEKGGAVAWGVVPNDAESLGKESVASLKDRLEEAMAPFTRQGVPFKQLLAQGLLTPSCGLSSLTEDAAEGVLELLAGLSREIRKKMTQGG